ncbi:hypothetical protein [secondary endosymbiont of Ctenarytaina eucalypti]|uniref:Uncharacterized protein n=1 Tax=secondary endosymbiont of Ctenarytaina eucalypti TaxID=1199245 RepID=J3Z4N7_9ENTR|nr:hypothetical protein [secondary endosymbiont of Ctenarytaina eucalypti]AFP85264.1 hypothetical protein A359_08980 [secondary endosymbiont of Ctenarytaina eucalypti]
MVLPMIIYAEVNRRMKPMFIIYVTLLVFSELLLLVVDHYRWLMFTSMQLFLLSFNIMEAALPSLITKESSAQL